MKDEEFYVYDSVRDTWLHDDERSFGSFYGRAIFSSREAAEDVAKREARGRTGLIVLSYKAAISVLIR